MKFHTESMILIDVSLERLMKIRLFFQLIRIACKRRTQAAHLNIIPNVSEVFTVTKLFAANNYEFSRGKFRKA